MVRITGNQLLARSLKRCGTEVIFYLMGGPCLELVAECMALGIKCIDTRDERGAALMAQAYSRVTGKVGVCITAAGPGTTNSVTGIASAFLDCTPVLAIGGSTALLTREMDVFQEIDLLNIMKPITKRAWQIARTERIPAYVGMAFRHALSSRPGPVYLDCPADVLQGEVRESQVGDSEEELHPEGIDRSRPAGDPEAVRRAVELLQKARRPIVIAGSGILWSGAEDSLRNFVEVTGIPFYTTPLSRGVIPEDHPLSFPGARSVAWRNADVVLSIGTRANFIVQHFLPPRFARGVKLIAVNIDAGEIGHNKRVEVGIVGDARAVLDQLTAEASKKFRGRKELPWINRLRAKDARRRAEAEPLLNSDQVPIHPLRLCREVRDFLPRDSILVADGNETLSFARQTIPAYHSRHRLNPGPFGCIGVGVPFGIGAKAAKPDKPVLVLSGDGSFGYGAIEMDTAIRHQLPIVVVVSNNGGWGAADEALPLSRDLGFISYEKVVEALGGYGERVEQPEDIRPALERAFRCGKPAVVNVITDPRAGAITQDFGAGAEGRKPGRNSLAWRERLLRRP
jgi:acetolactate synthase-1/2/3 large subunit